VALEKKKLFIPIGAATSALTNEQCSPYTVHWAYDTVALAKGTGNAVVKSGGKTWYFLTADYAFGAALQNDTSTVVKAAGGTIVGSVKHPLSASDFSSFLLQAQGSKAQILGLANAGGDTINSIKQASEFGIVASGQKLAGLLVFVNDIHALGLQTAQGLQLTEAFYWDQNDQTRAFSTRFEAVMKKKPSMIQAGVYGAVSHYLKAIKEVNTDEGEKVVAQMKKMPINDFMTKNGSLREDGRVVREMYLFEVKKPSESKGAWDYYKLVRTIPGDEAYRPMKDGGCSFVKS